MDIHRYAHVGDHAKLLEALAGGVPVDARDEEGRTPLMVAAASSVADCDTLRLLLERGADVNALTTPQAHAGPHQQAPVSVLAYAVKAVTPDRLRYLIEAGADVRFVNASGYSVLMLAFFRSEMTPWELHREILTVLIDAGAPLDVASKYGESPVRVASNRGRFAAVELLLDRGADAAPLGWTNLHRAIAGGDLETVQQQLDAGAALEARDCWDRTPFLLAVHAGQREIAELLLGRGADRWAKGRCDSSALSYAISQDNAEMLQWLIDLGYDIEASAQFDEFPLIIAAQQGARRCVEVLLDAGAVVDRQPQDAPTVIGAAATPEIVRLLAAAGGDLSDIGAEMRVHVLNTQSIAESVSEKDYRHHWKRIFGRRNPERMNNPLWDSQVRRRDSAYTCAHRFGDTSDERHPVWCFCRFGQSITLLPDGRYVEIGGEHEDFYDADFCIYNDVVVHDRGSFDLYGYPEAVFPTTDFHSATLVWPHIYIIGNVGYTHQRRRGETPVYRLDCNSWSISRLPCQGNAPGWIHRHQARLTDDQTIQIIGGQIYEGENQEFRENTSRYVLDLTTFIWTKQA